MFQNDAFVGQSVNQNQNALAGFDKRAEVGQLRTDVAVDADDFEVALAGGVAVGFERVGVGDAEFVGFQAGGDVGMGFGIDIGIDAQGDGGGFTQAFGNL